MAELASARLIWYRGSLDFTPWMSDQLHCTKVTLSSLFKATKVSPSLFFFFLFAGLKENLPKGVEGQDWFGSPGDARPIISRRKCNPASRDQHAGRENVEDINCPVISGKRSRERFLSFIISENVPYGRQTIPVQKMVQC